MCCPSKVKNGIVGAYYPRQAAAGNACAPPARGRGGQRRRASVAPPSTSASYEQEEPMAKQPRILAGETAAITGAARGIGRATAEAFLRQGMRVAIGDVDLATAQATAAELGAGTVALGVD